MTTTPGAFLPPAILTALLALSPHALAETATAKTLTVTSLQKCYDRLDREDALDIQRNYIKPWQECQRRLSLKMKKEAENRKAEEDSRPAPAPRNYYQVQKPKDEGKTPQKPAKSAAPE